jgi:hypothetical protein
MPGVVYVTAMGIMAGVLIMVAMIAVVVLGLMSFMAMRMVNMLAVIIPSMFLILIKVIVHWFAFGSLKRGLPTAGKPLRLLVAQVLLHLLEFFA